jgi:glyoxylase-like metal-dependent hydrolase (beta-lactamase superfamily II)
MEAVMNRVDNRVDRRTTLAGLAAATVLASGGARAQRGDPSQVQIKITDLGRRTYLLEGQGGNIAVAVGSDGIIMVDAELAPLHDKIKAALAELSNQPVKYLVNTHFHGEQTGGNAPFHRDGAIIVAQDNVRVRLLAGTSNPVTGNTSPPAPPDAIPTVTYIGGSKMVETGNRQALLTHATNAHTDGDIWIYFEDANVIFTGDLFYNNSRYPMIDYANGGDIRGMIRANEAFLKLANDATRIASSRGGAVAGKAEVAAFRTMLVTARDRMAELIGKGLSEEEAVAAKPFADLDATWADSERAARNFTRTVYNSFRRS